MKILATLFLALSLPGSRFAAPLPAPADHTVTQHARQGGTWYMAESGHAVFCYGPVMLLRQPNGGFQHVATFCRGDQTIVPLKD
ncbi:MAG TPA: hypothetical protein VK829_19485 [Terriglobales bacterium]|jgi:hypothetical protein|nr:hypothetical protein [Terriglobales bacterium]